MPGRKKRGGKKGRETDTCVFSTQEESIHTIAKRYKGWIVAPPSKQGKYPFPPQTREIYLPSTQGEISPPP